MVVSRTRPLPRRSARIHLPAALTIAALSGATLLSVASRASADPCKAPLPPYGSTFSGPVVYVGDGDSLCVATFPGRERDPGTWVEVRVADFYAPELHEPGGEQAKRALERLSMGRRASCIAGKRSYDRVVADCQIAQRDIGDAMRRAGIAEGGNGRH